jgi:outer membrane lipoprotein carrier protein
VNAKPVAVPIVALVLAMRTAGAQADLTSAQFADALQTRYDRVKDFSTDFVQTYRGGVLKKQLTERGRLLVKKPGKMRWEYKTPEDKLFVSDGVKIYTYIPQDNQVIVSSVPPENKASTPALFLAGKGSLTRDFASSLVELPADLPRGSRALKLVPKTAQPDYDWLILAVDPKTLELRGLEAVDPQGDTSTFIFVNMKENVGLSDNEFVFRIPRGADVVPDSPGR